MTRREKRVRRRVTTLAALTVAAFMTACAGAQAKTVTVGSPLTGSFTPVQIGLMPPPPSSCCAYFTGSEIGPRQAYDGWKIVPLTLAQARSAYPGVDPVDSPVDGTVISYRVAASEGTFAIQVLRTNGYGYSSAIVSSTPKHITATGVSAPIASHLAIRAYEQVGIRNFGEGDQLGLKPSGGSASAWAPPLVDGASARSPVGYYWGNSGDPYYGYTFPPGEIGLQATVRYCQVPSVEGKSLAVARKILSRADCRVGKLRQTNHVRGKREVIFQSVQPAFAISDTKPIKLWLSR